MSAPPLSSGRSRELAQLRSRAYGPNADIHYDADALTRLAELEEMARADTLAIPAPFVAVPATSERPQRSTPDPVVPAVAETTAAEVEKVDVEASDDGLNPADRRLGWWRRVPVWAYLILTTAVGLAVGLALPDMLAPQPDAVLHSIPNEDGGGKFAAYGADDVSPVRYEAFHGLEVWSVETDQGSTCVLVDTAGGQWTANGCAPEPLLPTADLTFYPSMLPVEGLDLPPGSVARFILRDGVVEVWIGEADEGA